jgi:hypothetical protein
MTGLVEPLSVTEISRQDDVGPVEMAIDSGSHSSVQA